ncbi:glycosyltransferase family 2 protein [Butyrivibrio sp. NC2007]|uniref:glycosyltransferase family 2 protein n=1 Tax=Butyrivibrio sp. NC2007 TaxID=1280683 RepID=UPI0018C9F746|nr:glycosyltransferase [Butyrivibrio sp. NC2007]
MDKTITIIIPFYNCKDALPRMLESILAGTMLPYEIILIDDGSSDGSSDVAYNYAQKYAFIKALSQSHAGVSAARNLGIKNAGGYWISFLDADDHIEPDMYAKMLEAIESASSDHGLNGNRNVDGCLCGYFTHKDSVVTPYSYNSSEILSSEDLLRLMFTDDTVRGFLFTRLFKTDLLKELSFDTDIRICEDLLFQTRLFSSKDVHFACLPLPMYHYIQDQASATVTKCFFDGETFIYKPAYDRISSCISSDYVLSSYNSILDYSMYTLLNQYKLGKNAETKAQIRMLQKEMRQTKTPLAQKSKRRIFYELAPAQVLISL